MNTDKDELRIKVAELCGWKSISLTYTPYKRYTGWPPEWPEFSKASYQQQMGDGQDIPDYLNDLNACHELLCVLVKAGWDIEIRNTRDGWKCLCWKAGACCNGEAQELPTAICLAFVKTMEGK